MPPRKTRETQGPGIERCFLVGAIVPGRYDAYEEPLAELASLVESAGATVVGSMAQKLPQPHRRSFLGPGKVEELAGVLGESGAETIVVDDALTPTQLAALESECRLKVIDRNEVILDIFNARARTAQAKLQVELAQLRYELPRLARKWTHLERLVGGSGTRGPGETQLETDRRIIRRRIQGLERKLEAIAARKVREVRRRAGTFTACLVGYTNAGKSTIMNALTGAGAYVADKLFATLDTLTRRLDFGDGTGVLISDTVGFIRRLPHHLIASFHATLEEAAQCDLLLHVTDAADPLAGRHLEAVYATIEELGLSDKPRLHILNKLDAVVDRAEVQALAARAHPAIMVSALTGEGLGELAASLHERASAGRSSVTLRFASGDGKRLAFVNSRGHVRGTRYEGNDAIIEVALDPADLARLKRLPGAMRVERR